ncbi:MAG: hypothetical protein OXT49_04270 [Gammaproteobacteria bacterium]|nr:hypothetical protein [Gammaproteobacteria bacterium]
MLLRLFLVLALLGLPSFAITAEDSLIILDEEDEDGESGFGIPLWGRKSVEPSPEQDPKSVEPPSKQPPVKQECIILDDEDEDEDGVCGMPIRFPGDARSKANAKAEGRDAVAPELYRVVLDEEDETNESGFGIPLPTEENPDPWNGQRSESAQPLEDIWDDD